MTLETRILINTQRKQSFSIHKLTACVLIPPHDNSAAKFDVVREGECRWWEGGGCRAPVIWNEKYFTRNSQLVKYSELCSYSHSRKFSD